MSAPADPGGRRDHRGRGPVCVLSTLRAGDHAESVCSRPSAWRADSLQWPRRRIPAGGASQALPMSMPATLAPRCRSFAEDAAAN